jgi:hypothetical protein
MHSEVDQPRELDVIQRWMQAVITHPLGVDAGADSSVAMHEIAAGANQLEQVVLPSSQLDAAKRIEIYANAYYGRLIECLANEFPVLLKAVGEETFNEFAFGYLQAYPSRSYTLNRLSKYFAKYLDETRPDREGLAEGENPEVSWPDFMIDLARLEWSIGEVFDAEGVEGQPLLTSEDIALVPPDRWANAIVEPVCCLRLLAFQFPVNDYFTVARRAENSDSAPGMPAPERQYLALFRRDYIVRRHVITETQFDLLTALQSGESLGVAIETAAERTTMSHAELASSLRAWFEKWTAAGLIHRVK